MLFSETWAKIEVFFECGGVWGIKNITGVARDTLKLYFTLTIKILSVSLISVSHFEPFPTLFQVIRYNTHEPIHDASFLSPTKALKYGPVYIP